MRHLSFGETPKSIFDMIIAKVRLAKVLKLVKGDLKILDLGCGYDGELINSLHGNNKSIGMDLSVNKKNKFLISGRVDRKLPFKDESFDIVTALAIIEHVEDPEMMLKEIYRVLKKGGKAIITTPSLAGKLPLEIMAEVGLISKTEIDDHKRYYTRMSLESTMKKLNFNSQVKKFGILYLNLIAIGVK